MADVSPEVLGKLVELIQAAGTTGAPASATFLDYVKGLSELLSSAAWPVAAVICVALFRPQLTKFIGEVDSVKIFGAEMTRKIDSEIAQSVKEAQVRTELLSVPSGGELDRARIVKRLAADTDNRIIVAQAEGFAAEYQQVRDSMLPGDERTRAMEVVVSKMRTIGQAFFPVRHEFAASPAPGKRLMAIASLEVSPDYDMLDWLAERISSEKPFVQYHALVAILLAAKAPAAKAYFGSFERAVEKLDHPTFDRATDRGRVLDQIKAALAELKTQAK